MKNRSNKKKIVVLGGGSGLSNLLRGIKKLDNVDITAIVTIADSGGSTGILSNQFKIPAVGDLRRVIASLSREREILEHAMEYRFKDTDTPLDGHTIGNLIITSQILNEGNFVEGVKTTSKMLNVQGTILPVSNHFNHLEAILVDGTHVIQEHKIGHSKCKIDKVFYHEEARACDEAVEAIKNADYIIFGIGSLYTSLMANLIYKNVVKALKATKAKVIYFANIWTQHCETNGMSIADHVEAIEKHTFKNIIDIVLISNTKLTKKVIESYKQDRQELIDTHYPNGIHRDLVSVFNEHNVKHDEYKILKALKEIID